MQETLIKALQTWSYRGIPENPGNRLLRVARNHALDLLRRDASPRGKLAEPGAADSANGASGTGLSLDDPLGADQGEAAR